MNVKVERCWDGHEREYFRMTMPDSKRLRVIGGVWNRSTAHVAKNLIEAEGYDVRRENIRFEHK